MKTLVLLIVVTAIGCEKTREPATVATPQPAADASTGTLANATELVSSDPPFFAATGNQGDYFVAAGGIWLLRGTEAVKVKEVEKFSTSAPWIPTTQKTVHVHQKKIIENYHESEPMTYDADEARGDY